MGGKSEPVNMSSNRPYLLRAIYDWIVDNDATPYLLVDAHAKGLRVPPGVARDGRVVLNIAPRAVAQIELGNDRIRFMARFGGVSHNVEIPVSSVQALYAHENGEGMMFPPETQDADADVPAQGMAEAPTEAAAGDSGDEPPRPNGPPRLRVVK